MADAPCAAGWCRCLGALAEWDRLFAVCQREWGRVEPVVRRDMAAMGAHAGR